MPNYGKKVRHRSFGIAIVTLLLQLPTILIVFYGIGKLGVGLWGGLAIAVIATLPVYLILGLFLPLKVTKWSL